MKEYMYNIYDEEAVIEETEIGVAVDVEIDGTKKRFNDYEKAVRFLDKLGYRF